MGSRMRIDREEETEERMTRTAVAECGWVIKATVATARRIVFDGHEGKLKGNDMHGNSAVCARRAHACVARFKGQSLLCNHCFLPGKFT